MEPISLILTALVAGVTGGALDALKDEAKEKATALYEKLRGLAKNRLANREDGERALERYPAAPKKWEAVLSDELAEAGAANDTELLDTAKALLALIDQAGTKSGKYNVTVTGGQGVVIGEGNTQTNTFNR
jgi:hypothetical protein